MMKRKVVALIEEKVLLKARAVPSLLTARVEHFLCNEYKLVHHQKAAKE
ncbi:MAG: hypothetical protein M1497_05255 [Nitrospirae bacterium]|nr:hypothetical protein [Nitrospirota bacterium]